MKQVNATPGGYYTGLINDMHKDYVNFKDKRTFLQMNYLNRLVNETKNASQFIEESRFDERKLEKFQSKIILNPLSITFTLPFDYKLLENLTALEYLNRYAKMSNNRKQTIHKLIRKIRHEKFIDQEDVKDIVFEYFQHEKSRQNIDELFHFLDINSIDNFEINDIVSVCCYAERYFFSKLENLSYEYSLQERIDFEFLNRKFDDLHLTNSLKRLIHRINE